jgi:hypothetical protein
MNSFISRLLFIFSVAFIAVVTYSQYNPIQLYAEEDCEDKAWKKYMKNGEIPYEKYIDRADDVPLPDDEDQVNDYLNKLDPLAEDYIDDLQPFAEDYIDDLGDCLN